MVKVRPLFSNIDARNRSEPVQGPIMGIFNRNA